MTHFLPESEPVSNERKFVSKPRLSLVLPYYDNPQMLALQLQHYDHFSNDIKRQMELVVVDDGSPFAPLEATLFNGVDLALKVYRIERDIRWNQDGARNIGAHEAHGTWLLLTDIDHIAPEFTIRKILEISDETKAYRFTRLNGAGVEINSHINSFLITKQRYWQIGGYDEDFRGLYGTDVLFINRLRKTTNIETLDEELQVFGLEEIPDANTRNYTRDSKSMRTRFVVRSVKYAKRFGLRRKLSVLREPYKEIFLNRRSIKSPFSNKNETLYRGQEKSKNF